MPSRAGKDANTHIRMIKIRLARYNLTWLADCTKQTDRDARQWKPANRRFDVGLHMRQSLYYTALGVDVPPLLPAAANVQPMRGAGGAQRPVRMNPKMAAWTPAKVDMYKQAINLAVNQSFEGKWGYRVI